MIIFALGQNLFSQTEAAEWGKASQAEFREAQSRSFEEFRSLRLLYRTVAQWEQGIQGYMLEQNFRWALALCLEAQRQYPEQERFSDYEASIREFLQVQQLSAEAGLNNEQQVELADQQEEDKTTLQERLVASAKQDPLLALQVGAGLHQGTSSVAKMAALNPFSEVAIDLYFTPSLGVHLFYYDSHWNLLFSRASKSTITLHSIVLGGSLRFQNKFNILTERSALRFSFDLGIGIYDMFPLLEGYEAHPVMILGFRFSDRPFYHFGGIEVLAGLQVDLSFSLLLTMQSDALSVVQTGNWEIKLWQTLGLFRLGVSYRGSFSEYYEQQRLLFFQHQFAFLVGLEWRTSFR